MIAGHCRYRAGQIDARFIYADAAGDFHESVPGIEPSGYLFGQHRKDQRGSLMVDLAGDASGSSVYAGRHKRLDLQADSLVALERSCDA